MISLYQDIKRGERHGFSGALILQRELDHIDSSHLAEARSVLDQYPDTGEPEAMAVLQQGADQGHRLVRKLLQLGKWIDLNREVIEDS